MDVDGIVTALLAGPLPKGPLVAALPMYDWPEERAVVDAQWVRLREALRAKGVDAPEHLARCNADLPTFHGSSVDLEPDALDLAALWRHPGLLFAQTCWGPLELWLGDAVRVVGQEDYSGVEGGDGEFYASAIVMRGDDLRGLSEAPPPLTYRGEPLVSPAFGPHKGAGDSLSQSPSHLWGGVRGGGTSLHALLIGQRLTYNAPDSMSGYLALERDLGGLDVFNERVISGGHRASIRMVANGDADVAAVDCKTWALALQHEPAARGLVVVGWTQKRKGLPYVCAGRLSQGS